MRLSYWFAPAGALLVAGTAMASPFHLYTIAVRPDQSITPSSGSFVTQNPSPGDEGAFLNPSRITVQTSRLVWRDNLDAIMASTFLTLDEYGPNGADGLAAYGTGWYTVKTNPQGQDPVHVPSYDHSISVAAGGLAVNGMNGDPVDGDGLSPGFYGASPGFAWDAGPTNDYNSFSTLSAVNGVAKQSLYLGHFVLSDPEAELVGDDLLLTVEGYGNSYLPLDGRLARPNGHAIPFWLEYERTTFTNSLGTFTALDMYLVPAPGILGIGVLGVPLLARRR